MTSHLRSSAVTSPFQVRFARDAADVRAAQRLRYEVFVTELGSDGPLVDHDQRLETDQFDALYDHLLLIDTRRADHNRGVVGAYRLLPGDRRAEVGRFYCEDEYDLSRLIQSDRRLLELGRSCLAPAYRGGAAMLHLWQGLARYVVESGTQVLFGVASFHGSDPAAFAAPLSLLHHRHLAPEGLRVISRVPVPMDRIAEDQLDRRAALAAVPALIKAYLRLGGYVGQGAYLDAAFNTVDICLILDVDQIPDRQRDSLLQGPPL